MNTKTKEPTKSAGAIKQAPKDREVCACCHFNDFGSGLHLEEGYLLAPDVRICAFCKLLFPQIKPKVPTLSDMEILGAWAGFRDAVNIFQSSLSAEVVGSRIRFERNLSKRLERWLTDEEFYSEWGEASREILWPMLALERVFKAMEFASVLCAENEGVTDAEDIRQMTKDELVAPVWKSWLGSNHRFGQSTKTAAQTVWAFYGEGRTNAK